MSIWRWLGASALCLVLALVFWRPLDVLMAFPPAIPETRARALVLNAAAGRPGNVLCDPGRARSFVAAARAYAAAATRSGRAWPDYYSMETDVDDAEKLIIAANLGSRVQAISISEAGFNYEKLRSFENPELLARLPREAREACREIIDYWGASGAHELMRLRVQRERARLEQNEPERARGVVRGAFDDLSRLYEQVARAESALVARLRAIRETSRGD